MHLDDNELALFALGDVSPTVEQAAHLQACARCDAELAALSRLVGVGRTLGNVEIVHPPDAVWGNIHSELGLAQDLRDVPREPGRAPGTPRRDAVPAGRRRRLGGPARRGALLGILAAAGLVTGLVAGIVGTSILTRPADPRVLAEAELEPFPDWQASGTARVEEATSGDHQIVVDISAPVEGLREVWLIDPETSGLISLGLLSGVSGTFSLPADLDLGRYSVVDVSQEPDDGNPAHSGNSIVRGALRSS
jgi:anti-sigma factor RsiW